MEEQPLAIQLGQCLYAGASRSESLIPAGDDDADQRAARRPGGVRDHVPRARICPLEIVERRQERAQLREVQADFREGVVQTHPLGVGARPAGGRKPGKSELTSSATASTEAG